MIYHNACLRISDEGHRCGGTVELCRQGYSQWLHCLMCGWRLEREIPRPGRLERHHDEVRQGRLVFAEVAG